MAWGDGKINWPRGPYDWIEGLILYISIPFTWNLPKIRARILQRSFDWNMVVVGGPATKLMPNYFRDLEFVIVGDEKQGILQLINPLATRTTIGCINRCGFCGVSKMEPNFVELDDWPDLPVICDNNLLAASINHFDKVIDRLIKWKWANFNQGIDARLLTDYHAMRIAEIRDPMIYLALDNISFRDSWECAYDRLRSAGLAKRMIRSYALIGFNTDPGEAWNRCEWIENHGIMVLPQWFHKLDSLEHNIVTEDQMSIGWNDYERKRIMQWFYQHKEAVKR